MSKIIDAKKMCEEKMVQQRTDVGKIREILKCSPCMVIISASDDKASEIYVKNKIRAFSDVGILVSHRVFPKSVTNEDILELIEYCNDCKVPLILQLPIYEHLDSSRLINAIDFKVDADGFSKEWIGEVNLGNDTKVAPATPKGVINLLNFHNIEIEGKVALVIGNSNHVSKPLCSMFMNRNATVLNANIFTKDLDALVRQSDIIVSCVGKPNLIKPEDIKEGAIVIGVGFTYVDGKQVLDFDVDKVVELGKAEMVSNRINCTGKATVNSLIDNTIELYKMNFDIEE